MFRRSSPTPSLALAAGQCVALRMRAGMQVRLLRGSARAQAPMRWLGGRVLHAQPVRFDEGGLCAITHDGIWQWQALSAATLLLVT